MKHEQLQFDKNYGRDLIGIPKKPDGNLVDREYFCIHDGIFDRIQSTLQNKTIMWKFISNEPNENEYHSKSTEICDNKIQYKKRSIAKKINQSYSSEKKAGNYS